MVVFAVPQWQGATWDGARERLGAGCRLLAALAADVLGTPVREVPVGATGSSTVDGIANRAALVGNRRAQLAALEDPQGPVLTIGGDCSADLVPLGVARYRYGPGLGAVWFDAHADCNTAATSPSGAFHGMVLRSLLGDGDPGFAASPALERGRAVLVGTRAFDSAERRAVADGLVRHVPAEPAAITGAVTASGDTKVYLHLDLDVLDPAEFGSLAYYHEPGGLSVEQLVAGIESLAAFEVVGACIAECTAARREDVEVLLPVLEAVAGLLA
ncbi:arginase family protein [Prauserella cavernicola]|uniref:Arginase family protein n=1 Tax=Prauserella cavernicola TaxID=2800127 RepID=A0A934QV07_9PSEU|nr:arginase family protein [Prauserella cavernicola]MBK1786841.1 arginase family protein [Prauserella cavernicola]